MPVLRTRRRDAGSQEGSEMERKGQSGNLLGAEPKARQVSGASTEPNHRARQPTVSPLF